MVTKKPAAATKTAAKTPSVKTPSAKAPAKKPAAPKAAPAKASRTKRATGSKATGATQYAPNTGAAAGVTPTGRATRHYCGESFWLWIPGTTVAEFKAAGWGPFTEADFRLHGEDGTTPRKLDLHGNRPGSFKNPSPEMLSAFMGFVSLAYVSADAANDRFRRAEMRKAIKAVNKAAADAVRYGANDAATTAEYESLALPPYEALDAQIAAMRAETATAK